MGGCLLALAWGGCQKVPEPRKEVPFNNIELKAKDMIESVGGEIAERNEEGRITMVVLSGPEVTDATLKPLENLSQLVSLELRNTKVTPKGFAAFRKVLPKSCNVVFGPGDRPERKKKE